MRSARGSAKAPHGAAHLDLIEGKVTVQVQDLPQDRTWQVWLLDNESGAGHGALHDDGDDAWRIGALVLG
jgi:hypothetical protein